MDLEDKILKFSLATDLKDDIRHDEEDRYIFQFSQQPRATPYYLLLLLRSGSECEESQTRPVKDRAEDLFEQRPGRQKSGPKGVLADKRWSDFQQSKRHERTLLEDAHARQSATGGHFARGTVSLSLSAQRAAAALDRRKRDDSDCSEDEDGERLAKARQPASAAVACTKFVDGGDTHEVSDDDEAALRRYRAARLAELRANLSLPLYGDVIEIEDRLELPDALDAGEVLPWRLLRDCL